MTPHLESQRCIDDVRGELHRRIFRPQRHRLLQGYPMAPLMRRPPAGFEPFAQLELDPDRPLIIGVIPHTFCNPKVKGCGFCTFPHERLSRSLMRSVLKQVQREIEITAGAMPGLRARAVKGVYLGGGTANLTPPDELHRLLVALSSSFDLIGSELTLEGVPSYFLQRQEALLDVIGEIGVRHPRISMGIQTFDSEWLRRMGRQRFGDRDTVQRVVDAAHRRGFSASADLLFNLPGASAVHALADVRSAVDVGFDQICVYNLVLNSELRTVWARNARMVRSMPDNASACATWLTLRDVLIEAGYVQTTLTNFERREAVGAGHRFEYERASFDPGRFDGIGFGPGAISTFTDRHHRALKWMNDGLSLGFIRRMQRRGAAIAASFEYTLADLRLLHLTRSLSKLSINRGAYRRFFGTDPLTDFSDHWMVLEEAHLVRIGDRNIALTPEGMFYADAVVGLLACQRVAELRAEPDDSASIHDHMG
jgi:coproporphyrinogen III oxidase-like Fe-S oxidoreductase